jgi:ATP-dependent exoDNAse (exonuclease V) beta subunit
VVAQNTPSHRADAGAAWGTLIHGLLEHAMRFPQASREDLRRLAMWLTVEEPQLRAVIDEALDTVETVARADFWAAAQSSTHVVEAPFIVRHSESTFHSGVIDVLHETGNGWRVIDYKTDASLAGGDKYATQLERYKQALEACGLPVSETVLAPVRLEGSHGDVPE